MTDLKRTIDKVLDDASEMGRSSFPEDYIMLKGGMVATILSAFKEAVEAEVLIGKLPDGVDITCAKLIANAQRDRLHKLIGGE